MHAWKSIQETIDHIEKHYGENIDIKTLASIANLSSYYYQRLFYRLVKKNVGEYIQLRRLVHSTYQLKYTQNKILDIALDCGFQSHSHFSRTFKNIYGISPDMYRKGNYTLDEFIKPDLSLKYIIIDEGVPLIMNDMVLEIKQHTLKEAITFIGLSCLSPIQELGESKVNQLTELWQQLPKGDSQYKADILTLTEDPAYFNYFLGIEAKEKNTDNYETRTMPQGLYVVCSYEAENFEQLVNIALYKASQYLYDIWLPQHQMIPEAILVQKYFHRFEKNCYIELWAKINEQKPNSSLHI